MNGLLNPDTPWWNPVDDEGRMKTGGMNLPNVPEWLVDFMPGVGDVKAVFYDAPKSFKAAWESPTLVGKAGNTGAGLLALASAFPLFAMPLDALRAGIKAGRLSKADELAIKEIADGSARRHFKRPISLEDGPEYGYVDDLGFSLGDPMDRQFITDVNLDDFLDLAEPLTEGPRVDDLEAIRTFLKTGTEANPAVLRDIPYLDLARDPDLYEQGIRRIGGHEGRHRALALKELGYETMPVRIMDPSIRWGQQSRGFRNPGALADDRGLKYDYTNRYPTLLRPETGYSRDKGNEARNLLIRSGVLDRPFPLPEDAYDIQKELVSLLRGNY